MRADLEDGLAGRLALMTAAFAVSAVGCGSGAVSPPGVDVVPPSATASGAASWQPTPTPTTSKQDEQKQRRFAWVLPPGDTSPREAEGPLYGDLRRCAGAKEMVARSWPAFQSPRNVLLYMAGAYLCLGDRAGARPYWKAADAYGWKGLRDPQVCDVYKSVASVMRQAPRTSFACRHEGESPPFKVGPGGTDNPLTFTVDESQQEPSGSPSAEPSGSPSAEPSGARPSTTPTSSP